MWQCDLASHLFPEDIPEKVLWSPFTCLWDRARVTCFTGACLLLPQAALPAERRPWPTYMVHRTLQGLCIRHLGGWR